MVCKSGNVCKNCAECFGCHAMKSATVVGNCRPKACRVCPKERALRRAEDRAQLSTGRQNPLQSSHLTGPMPSISKTIQGSTTSYVIKGDYSLYTDQSGQHFRFPQCPGLTFSSMERAFEYFEAHAKLQKQRAAQTASQWTHNAAQQEPTAQQVRRAGIFDPSARIGQLIASLAPANVKPVVRLPPQSYLGLQGPKFQSVAGSVAQDLLKVPGPVYSSSISSLPDTPPQTLFAESRPHAREIKAQPKIKLPHHDPQSWPFKSSQGTEYSNPQRPLPGLLSLNHAQPPLENTPSQTLFAESTPHAREIQAQPRIKVPHKDSQSWPFNSQGTDFSNSHRPLPGLPPLNHEQPPLESHTSPDTCHNDFSPSFPRKDDKILVHPQNSPNSPSPPSSYSAIALPITLAKKDRRVLGVPLTADVDEIRAGFWLRLLQYNADRLQAATLEDRAIAVLKLTRAQEAVERLCGIAGAG